MARWNSRKRNAHRAIRIADSANGTTQPAMGEVRSTWDRSTTRRESFQGSSKGLARGVLRDEATLKGVRVKDADGSFVTVPHQEYARHRLGKKKTGKGHKVNQSALTFMSAPSLVPDKDANRPTPKPVRRQGFKLVPKGKKTWSEE